MKYAPPIGSADPNAGYVDRTGSIPGSPVPAAAIEPTMREIENCIKQAGLTPDASDHTQLWQAINKKTEFFPFATKQIGYASSGTFVPPSDGLYRIIVVGGGGGGGGLSSTSAKSGASGGGGGGGWVEAVMRLEKGKSYAVVVGSGGNGGSPGGNGGAGGASSFGGLLSGGGGYGGEGLAGTTTSLACSGYAGGISSYTPHSSILTALCFHGTSGTHASLSDASSPVAMAVRPGFGGASCFGGGAFRGTTTGDGTAGTLAGEGGSGGCLNGVCGNAAGGKGAPGAVIIQYKE